MQIPAYHFHVVLELGYAVGPGDLREDPIPMMIIGNVLRVIHADGKTILAFTTPDTARDAHDLTGWPFASDTRLELQSAGDHVTSRAPWCCQAKTAFYSRWYVSPDRSPLFRH